MKKKLFFSLMALLSVVFLHAADQVVTSNAGAGNNTLRTAIINVGAGETITFNLSAGNETIVITEDLEIYESLTIDGSNTAGSGTSVTIQVTVPGTTDERVFYFFSVNSGKVANLSNMTIKGGDLTSQTGASSYGGSIYNVSYGTLNLDNVTVSGSKAYNGGGIYVQGEGASLSITSSTIDYCTASKGGGIYVGTNASLTIAGSTINYNTTTSGGGGIYLGYAAPLIMSNSTVSYNSVTNSNNDGGGGILTYNAVTLTNVELSYNTSVWFGGGLHLRPPSGGVTPTQTIAGCDIHHNQCTGIKHGAGVAIQGTNGTDIGHFEISNTSFYENDFTTSTGYGGGLYTEFYDNGTVSTIDGCVFYNNEATNRGGGICFHDTYCTISNTTLANNTADQVGGGMRTSGSTNLSLINCTIAGNHSDNNDSGGEQGGGFYLEGSTALTCKNTMIADNYKGSGTTAPNDYYGYSGTLTDNGYNIVEIQYGSISFGVINNFLGQQANLFGTGLTTQTLADNGGPTLTLATYAGSVTINAGTLMGAPTTDQRGYERVGNPDIGAYESGGTHPVATWAGTTNTDWNTSTNWSGGIVPVAVYNVTIPDVANNPVVSSSDDASCFDLTVNTGGSLTVQSGGSLITDDTITNNGAINVQQTISDGQWHFISAPNNNTTASTFSGNYLQSWNETTALWNDITNAATALVPTQGYSLWGVAKATTYTFAGTPNTGEQTIGMTSAGGGVNDGMNLLGNPYPSSIDWDVLDETYGTIYYWDSENGHYDTWSGSGSTNGGQQYLPPMQGFFVYTTEAKDFTIDNSARTHENATSFYKSGNKEIQHGLRLEATTENGLKNDILLLFRENTNAGFDFQSDAWKFFSGTSGMPEIYMIANNQKLALEACPETETIQLGFTNDLAGIYSIAIKEIADIPEAFLEDTKTNTFHNLTKGAYEFIWNPETDIETRFKLHFKAVGINENQISESNILIYAAGQEIFIKNVSDVETYRRTSILTVTDILGRTVLQQNISGSELFAIPVDLETGVYIVMVRSGSGSGSGACSTVPLHTEKVLIK